MAGQNTATSSKGSRQVGPPSIHLLARVAAGVVGTGSLVFGAIGVFTVSRDFGPIALLVVGSVFLLVSLVGRIPNLKWEGKELTWLESQISDAVTQVVESDTREEKRDALLDILDVAPAVVTPALRALANEDSVLTSVKANLPEGVGLGPGVKIDRWFSDAVLNDLRNGEKILVEVRNQAQFSNALVDIVRRAKEIDTLIVGGLLLVNGEMTSGGRARLETSGWVVFDASSLSEEESSGLDLQQAILKAFSSGAKEQPSS
jgi:hypothetical protein